MSPELAIVVVVLIAALGIAYVINRLLALRAGLVSPTPQSDQKPIDTSDLGLSRTGPTVVHFGAQWCGPCEGLRRVVEQVCAELPAVAHVEIDMDANPDAARRLSVLSLPTTFIFDADGRQRYRVNGVPTAADLRSALTPLLA
ncbi:thiol reductase thioredoxin [Mycolicibacterium agri]|uniref:Thiol reductase thioredoxin n=1 Tax=Mycolicibacterium agri TaxID=36811 RepID=A0A2A7MWH9_MYCAG|nr:thioredoxin family protein [Mycolicibacterium agri]PEG35900.1 thiol reductase thioredoxin [Mycolicibacterium agri]GFG54264.1 thiol reductase thioredoxin [Mycolicibacterium agri]